MISFIKHQQQLIRRRGGLMRHLKLEYRFWQIGRDEWVKKSRKLYKDAQQ